MPTSSHSVRHSPEISSHCNCLNRNQLITSNKTSASIFCLSKLDSLLTALLFFFLCYVDLLQSFSTFQYLMIYYHLLAYCTVLIFCMFTLYTLCWRGILTSSTGYYLLLIKDFNNNNNKYTMPQRITFGMYSLPAKIHHTFVVMIKIRYFKCWH